MSDLDMSEPTDELAAAIEAEQAAYLAGIRAWLDAKANVAAAVECGDVIVLADWRRDRAAKENEENSEV
jgi:hypothetical protein